MMSPRQLTFFNYATLHICSFLAVIAFCYALNLRSSIEENRQAIRSLAVQQQECHKEMIEIRHKLNQLEQRIDTLCQRAGIHPAAIIQNQRG